MIKPMLKSGEMLINNTNVPELILASTWISRSQVLYLTINADDNPVFHVLAINPNDGARQTLSAHNTVVKAAEHYQREVKKRG